MSIEGRASASRRRRIATVALCGFALALLAGAVLVSPGGAEDYGPDLETYLLLIERYRSGDAESPLRAAGSWGPIWIESTAGRLLDACKSAPVGETAGLVGVAQGAFLLHTHAALAGRDLGLRSPDHNAHVEAARRLLRWFRDRYRDGSWPREARGLTPRDFYLALASAELLMARPVAARTLAEESLRSEGDDGEMRLLAGCAVETEALMRRQTEGHWPDDALRNAEHRFAEALGDDPALLEARLRLGWALVRRGRAERGRPYLETVAETPGDDGRRALAWLFLGRAHEKRQDPPAAVEAYRRAIEIAPQFQAAHIALAHALEDDAGDEAARAILVPYFLERSRSWVRADPWNEYPFGPPEMRLRPFEALLERLCER